jgi:hypothetical protein
MAYMKTSPASHRIIAIFTARLLLVSLLVFAGVDCGYCLEKEYRWGASGSGDAAKRPSDIRSQRRNYRTSSVKADQGLFNHGGSRSRNWDDLGDGASEQVYFGTAPGSFGSWMINRFSLPESPSIASPGHYPESLASLGPSLINRGHLPVLLNSPGLLNGFGSFPTSNYINADTLQIEVSHSKHTFRLIARTRNGGKRILHQCKVGLGAASFPTPVGTYYVTHIYDDDPWWIPPENRAWAAGQRPSRRVYGGTMAPLLKKKPERGSKRPHIGWEDLVSGRQKYADYGYRFHGTNSPRSIGRNQSHGCVRMLNKDAKRVADLIKGFAGEMGRGRTENGEYATLGATIKLELVP